MKKVSRSRFLKLGLVGGAGLALPAGAFGSWRALRPPKSSPPVDHFRVPLPVPPVLKPARSDADTDYYEVTQKEREVEFLPGLKTAVWGYDGIFPGPTIEARSGRRVVVRQTNELPVPVSTHLHGGKTPPESDGYPTDLIPPKDPKNASSKNASPSHPHGGHTGMNMSDGGPEAGRVFRDYVYPNEQRAATLWYHDHRMDFTGPQVYRGLAGLYIVRDGVEDSLPLPGGEKDVPLMITDRIFEEDGSFFYPSVDPSLTEAPGVTQEYFTDGVRGDTVLVNGAPWPVMEVSNTRYRFRILNASNARAYELALDPPPPGGGSFVQVASDGGLLEAPIRHDRLLVSQAERFDVVVDFSRYPVGTQVTLRNLFGWENLLGVGRTSEVMRFDVVREEKDESAVPEKLAAPGVLPVSAEAEVTRSFRFTASGGMWTINGKHFEPDRVDYRPALGATEIWEFVGAPDHPVHVHLVNFRVLSRDDRGPGPYDAGWKDTVFLRGGSVRVIARFTGYRGNYVLHCHNLEHEDMMMMENFEVV